MRTDVLVVCITVIICVAIIGICFGDRGNWDDGQKGGTDEGMGTEGRRF